MMAPRSLTTKTNSQTQFGKTGDWGPVALPRGGSTVSFNPKTNIAAAGRTRSFSASAHHIPHQHNGPLVPLPHCAFHRHEERKCRSTSHLPALRRTVSQGARAFKPGKFRLRDAKSLQNTLGGTSITSATPTALSSHMDPKALAVAAGIGATTFAPMGREEDDNNVDRQYSYEREGMRERSMSDGQEYLEEPEEERFTSDLMQATTIGENRHSLQYPTQDTYTGQYTPLLEKDPLDFPVPQPKTVTYQKQPEIKFPLNTQDASLACELNIGNINNYRLRRGTNDGTFCYSIFLIVGVLLMGVGIILYILQALLGYKAVESVVGGIMFVTGVVVLICSMVGWKRRALHNEKKMAHV